MRGNPHHSYGITVKQGAIIRKGYNKKIHQRLLMKLDKNRLTGTGSKGRAVGGAPKSPGNYGGIVVGLECAKQAEGTVG
jgi:hypothetical protein